MVDKPSAEDVTPVSEEDVNALTKAVRAADYAGFDTVYQSLPELVAMQTVWEVADRVRETAQFETCYDFGVRAQRERSVNNLWGTTGLEIYRAISEEDYEAYKRLIEACPEGEIADAIPDYLVKGASELSPGDPLHHQRYARAMEGYVNGTAFRDRFNADKTIRELGVSF